MEPGSGMRIIQLTDCHIQTDALAEIRGVPTRETFERVMRRVDEHHSHAERLIVTGDLTHDERRSTYDWLRTRWSNWLPRLRIIPGNHDDRPVMREVFPEQFTTDLTDRNCFVDTLGHWRLIGLDTHVPGQLQGELGSLQLDWLTTQIRDSEAPVCLFLHHPPISMHSPWLDRIGLTDREEFQAVIHAMPQVKAVFCGHVHQERIQAGTGPLICTTPSTGVQFRPETDVLEVDRAHPGYRVIDLPHGSEIQTRVERVAD